MGLSWSLSATTEIKCCQVNRVVYSGVERSVGMGGTQKKDINIFHGFYLFQSGINMAVWGRMVDKVRAFSLGNQLYPYNN